jgi:uncharacterized RDD family membrane protein YckC
MSSSPIGFTSPVPSPDVLQAQLNSPPLNSPPLNSDDLVNTASTIDPTETAATAAGISPAADSPADVAGYQPDSWRDEVAARLNRYRTRRKPRAPRYPSLLLPFDASSSWLRPAKDPLKRNEGPEEANGFANGLAPDDIYSAFANASAEETTGEGAYCDSDSARDRVNDREKARENARENTRANDQSNLIEFPRFAAIPVFHANTLADPIFDRPRIVEAPEILPPPPALGGMLMEPVKKEPVDLRASDSPAASASIGRRALAALVDGAILTVTIAAIVAIFLYVNPSMNVVRGPLPLLAAALGVLTVILWMAYEYSFVVYTGSTPGLRIACLRLATFDGRPLNRRVRTWRVLTSFLSAFSAGLGYLWCLLDQNALCWHDRITRTHLQKGPDKLRAAVLSSKGKAPTR